MRPAYRWSERVQGAVDLERTRDEGDRPAEAALQVHFELAPHPLRSWPPRKPSQLPLLESPLQLFRTPPT